MYIFFRQTMDNQLAEMLAEPSGEFDNFVRMSNSDFEFLIQKVSPVVAKQDTDWREAIPVKIRLALTLRYLATGDSFRSLHYLFKISSQLISRIVPEVCLALNEALKDFVKVITSYFNTINVKVCMCVLLNHAKTIAKMYSCDLRVANNTPF